MPCAVVSLAWACAPAGSVVLEPESGASGATVSVRTSGFPSSTPVEVRWNGGNGPLVARGTGPGFTATFTVPNVPGGTYIVIAETDDEHASHTQARAAFTVTGAAPPGTSPPPPPPPPPPTGVRPPPTNSGASDQSATPSSPIETQVLNPFTPTPAAGGKVITGTDGADRLVGTPGRDVIRCGRGNDIVSAGAGNDFIDCGVGQDRVNGGAGDDEIRGAGGNDILMGDAGDDDILGAAGNDKLAGGRGNDELSGGSGIDTLRGNGGRDRLSGGPGRDVVYFEAADRMVRGSARDRDRVLR